MSNVQELVFSYTTEGAKAAQRADEKVRRTVQETGKTAQQQSGRVQRWMTANKRAIQGLALASAGAMTAVLSSSSRVSAELSGLRSAFGLLADTIVGQLLPSSGSLATSLIGLVQSFRAMPGPIKTAVSALSVIGGVVAGVAATVGSTAALIVGGFLSWAAIMIKVQQRFGALQNTVQGWMNLGKSLAALLTGDFGKAWDFAQKSAGQFFTAMQKVWTGVLTWIVTQMDDLVGKAVGWGKSLINDLVGAIENRVNKVRSAAADVRDRITERITEIVSTGRTKAQDFVDGIQEKISGGVSSVKNAATDLRDKIVSTLSGVGDTVAGSFVDAWNGALGGTSLDLPEVTWSVPGWVPEIGGEAYTIGGESLSIPKLATGGFIEQGGLAQLHAGERVMPAEVSDRGGGGGRNITVQNLEIVIQGSGNPRRDGRNAAEEVAEQFERNLGGRGV